MGGLTKSKLFGWGKSSRPRAADALDRLEDRGAGMSAKQRKEFLAREDAKQVTGNGLAANTPLSSRYA